MVIRDGTLHRDSPQTHPAQVEPVLKVLAELRVATDASRTGQDTVKADRHSWKHYDTPANADADARGLAGLGFGRRQPASGEGGHKSCAKGTAFHSHQC